MNDFTRDFPGEGLLCGDGVGVGIGGDVAKSSTPEYGGGWIPNFP